MLSTDSIRNISTTQLPSVEVRKKLAHVAITWVSRGSETIAVNATISKEHKGAVSELSLTGAGQAISVITRGAKKATPVYGKPVIHTPDPTLKGNQLWLGDGTYWAQHPDVRDLTRELNCEIVETWEFFPKLVQERVSAAGIIDRTGFRIPQLGALHAIASHWTVKTTPAKVVLPTGTGKTDVLIGAVLMHRFRRTLLVVPSDALRTQAAEKFSQLQTLRNLKLIDPACSNPIVGVMTKVIEQAEHIGEFAPCHVVIATSSMLSLVPKPIAQEFIESFDAVFFDEAHHLAAPTWERMLSSINPAQKMLAVTATPFRNDGKKLPGETIYQFPLRLAQKFGYFKPIVVVEVDEADEDKADDLIAEEAVKALRADEQENAWKHVVMARARSIKHATDLFNRVYSEKYAELSPVLIHSKTPKNVRHQIIEGIRRLEHRIVVCVDMLGEGFDFAALKIAAMHELHKSLPVTLQFIGRFTRSSEHVGTPTLVVNVARASAPSAVSSLYEQDADWNELLPEISARAIKSEHDVEAFTRSMRTQQSPEGELFDLALIKPKTSSTFYKVGKFLPIRYKRAFSQDVEIHQTWQSEDEQTLVTICRQRSQPEWSTSKGASDSTWALYIAHHEPTTGLLHLHSSEPTGRANALAKALSADTAKQLSGEDMFRAFNGLNRTVLHNVGLYRKGNLRFQMLAGLDIGSHVSAATQAGSGKSNLFAVGYEDGQKTSIGVSFKGRAWSMSSSSIPDWIAWTKRTASKITDENIKSDEFFDYVLIPDEISTLPTVDVFACVVPDSMLLGDHGPSKRYLVNGMDFGLLDVDVALTFISSTGSAAVVEVQMRDQDPSRFQMSWGPFRAQHLSGPSISVVQRGETTPLADYFVEHPPVLLLRDGSEVAGKYHFKSHLTHPYTFSKDSIHCLDWGSVPITAESKWKDGQQRQSSVQGYMLDLCKKDQTFTFVLDDDDAQEAADIIGLIVDSKTFDIEVRLFHCKYSGGSAPGARVNDLYEVCGQAVKSTRLVHRADALFDHIVARESRLGGRTTRFEKGTLGELKAIQRDIHKYRVRTQVAIVQPGLSAAALTPDMASILGAADNFVFEFTGKHLHVYGSS